MDDDTEWTPQRILDAWWRRYAYAWHRGLPHEQACLYARVGDVWWAYCGPSSQAATAGARPRVF
jgi:hypothetical protein